MNITINTHTRRVLSLNLLLTLDTYTLFALFILGHRPTFTSTSVSTFETIKCYFATDIVVQQVICTLAVTLIAFILSFLSQGIKLAHHWPREGPQQDYPETGYLLPLQWETDQLSICQEQQLSTPQEAQHSQWVPEMPLIPPHTLRSRASVENGHNALTIGATRHVALNLLHSSNIYLMCGTMRSIYLYWK